MGGLEIVWNWRIQFDKLGGHLVVRWTQFKLEYCWGINDKTTHLDIANSTAFAAHPCWDLLAEVAKESEHLDNFHDYI